MSIIGRWLKNPPTYLVSFTLEESHQDLMSSPTGFARRADSASQLRLWGLWFLT